MLQIKIVGIKEKDVLVRIVRQDYRGSEFFDNGKVKNDYFQFNGFCLKSVDYPEYDVILAPKTFFCRGLETSKDNDVVFVPLKVFGRLKRTIDEYNKQSARKC